MRENQAQARMRENQAQKLVNWTLLLLHHRKMRENQAQKLVNCAAGGGAVAWLTCS
jgi:hypothetical protein